MSTAPITGSEGFCTIATLLELPGVILPLTLDAVLFEALEGPLLGLRFLLFFIETDNIESIFVKYRFYSYWKSFQGARQLCSVTMQTSQSVRIIVGDVYRTLGRLRCELR